MKKFKLLFLYSIVITIVSSCSDTVVVKNIPDDGSTAPAISGYFKKNVLIEDYTGTWCGNCTRVSYAIELTKLQSQNIIPVAIHNGNDPYHFAGIAPLKNLILPNSQLALPVSRLNRTLIWTFPETSNIQEAINLTGNNSGVGIAMNSSVANGNINLDVNMKFVLDYSNLKLVVYLLEDGLIHFQRNYTNFYNAENPILNYEHNHVLRVSMTDILGDSITEETKAGDIITKSFSIPVPANIENPDNLNFVAFLVGSNNISINARSAHANENQAFQENP